MTLTERFINRNGRRIRQLADPDGVIKSESIADILPPSPENPDIAEGMALVAQPVLTAREQTRLLQLIGKFVFTR